MSQADDDRQFEETIAKFLKFVSSVQALPEPSRHLRMAHLYSSLAVREMDAYYNCVLPEGELHEAESDARNLGGKQTIYITRKTAPPIMKKEERDTQDGREK